LQARVHGFLHVMPGSRVKDQLNNRDEQFLAITFATIMKNANPGANRRRSRSMSPSWQSTSSTSYPSCRSTIGKSTEDDEEGYHY
jgi:hypothetical protein